MDNDIEIDFDLKGTLDDLKKQLDCIKESMENSRCKCDKNSNCCPNDSNDPSAKAETCTEAKGADCKESKESDEAVGSKCPYSKDSKVPGKCPYLIEMYAGSMQGAKGSEDMEGLDMDWCGDCKDVSKCPMFSSSGSMLADFVTFVLMLFMFVMMVKSTMRMFE